jgi:hypothetical protein
MEAVQPQSRAMICGGGLDGPVSGTVSLIDAHLVYTPTVDFLGSDVFTYTVSSSTDQADATVTVLVVTEVFRVFLPLIQR